MTWQAWYNVPTSFPVKVPQSCAMPLYAILLEHGSHSLLRWIHLIFWMASRHLALDIEQPSASQIQDSHTSLSQVQTSGFRFHCLSILDTIAPPFLRNMADSMKIHIFSSQRNQTLNVKSPQFNPLAAKHTWIPLCMAIYAILAVLRSLTTFNN
jgi:hypothetical protein